MAFANGYSWRGTITIDHTQVPSTQSNFPVLVSVTDTHLKYGGGGVVTSSSGYDIVFFSTSDGSGSKLAHEVELNSWNSATGAIIAWVNVASVSSSSDTVIYMFAGNAAVSTSQQAATTVWSAYFGVWHLPNGSSLTAGDSTSNANTGTLAGGTPPAATAGVIDGGGNFTGAGYISLPNQTALSNVCTVSAWFYYRNVANEGRVYARGSSNGNDVSIQVVSSAVRGIVGADGGSQVVGSSTGISSNTWYHVALVFGSSRLKIYINGVIATDDAAVATLGTSVSTTYIGGRIGPASLVNGIIDETQSLKSALSADWIKAEYNNQKPSSTFLSLGSWLFSPSGGGLLLMGVGS